MQRFIEYPAIFRQSLAALFRLAAVLGVLLATASEAIALTPVDITGSGDTLPLGPHMEYLKDPQRNLALADVQARRGDFRPNTREVLNIGYSSAGFWVQFRLRNTGTEPLTRFLEFRSLFVDRLTLYRPLGQGQFQEMESGRLVPPPDRPYAARTFVFPISLPPDTDAHYYLYVASADTLTIPLYLHTSEGLQHTELITHSWLTFFQGLIVTMTVFSLFLLATLRDRVYGYYIGVIVIHQGMFFTLFNGLGYQYFGLEHPWWSREALSVLVSLAMWMIIQFTRVLLATREQQPHLDRLVVVIQHAALIIAGLSLFLDYYISIRMANPLASATALTLWLVGWNSLRKGNPAARYFLIAWTMLIIGGLAYSLKSWGLVPSNVFTEHSWQIGAAIEAIFLSLAIADRINTESRQRLRLQKEAQRAQAKALDIQRRANETLEQRVQERTEALREANRKLQRLSETDQLTNISNRRSLERYLQHAVERALVDGQSIAIVLIDVDHFKPVNDTHGHQVGDDCLQVVAERIQTNARWPADMVARYGGEEFCVVLPATDGATATEIGERIRQCIEREPIPTRIGPVPLTASMGIFAGTPAKGDTVENMLLRADQALYHSKQKGRNRVTLYGTSVTLNN
ncbi:diguanylate cyclase [Marinobacter salarius]|uniref:sensor domain-containing diguanylate cyclase n=1 Tax=Marinobacter salarius TaxID=1420917 RepID=UPI0018F21751|nr:diguanylate cyclase [Marinobacter salarius]MBJ7275444.1 diguanylate cyclase [Marinobacter salarius]